MRKNNSVRKRDLQRDMFSYGGWSENSHTHRDAARKIGIGEEGRASISFSSSTHVRPWAVLCNTETPAERGLKIIVAHSTSQG